MSIKHRRQFTAYRRKESKACRMRETGEYDRAALHAHKGHPHQLARNTSGIARPNTVLRISSDSSPPGQPRYTRFAPLSVPSLDVAALKLTG
ncbi:hypothetical protein [Teredinibacter haidensis]|uniref:hypothetical protein n=1 Tax=Teredinibacter haidensis TaxID=2731755 RepID=UPI00111538AA|nr:hypothetical protein [Teredinibacter haidensis]